MNEILNKEMTIKEFATICGTADTEVYKKLRDFMDMNRELFPEDYASGRTNYIKFQKAICDLSNGVVTYGGQGKGRPDCYLNGQWCETKAYKPTARTTDVAASSFFASNSKVPEWKRLKKESEQQARDFLFEHSYNKNDYYCLTGTKGCVTPFEDVKLMFVTKDTLVSHLKEDYRKLDLESLRDIKK
tara:strand:+ start:132 stop:692 length:561 start_codon:yes stop_codon:yes gene_type:complete